MIEMDYLHCQIYHVKIAFILYTFERAKVKIHT